MPIIKAPLWLYKSRIEKTTKKRLKNVKSFGNFNVKGNLSYIDDDLDAHKLDIYTPAENGNGITLFYIHGGAYVARTKEDSRIFASWFANQGFNVVVMNYRYLDLSEKITLKDQVHDVFKALLFVGKHKLYYKLNLKNFFIVGDSSGGHLALLVDIILKNKDAREIFEINEVLQTKYLGIALNSPMYDYCLLAKYGSKYLTKKALKELFGPSYKNEEILKMMSPRYYFNSGYTPCPLFVSTSFNDRFRTQSYLLNKDCKKLGYEITYHYEPSPRKVANHIYNHFMFDEEGLKCNIAMVDFFLKHSVIDK